MSKLNKVFSNWMQIVICLILGILFSGCGGLRPPLETLLHQPDPSLKTQELRPANITVLPVKDERQAFASRNMQRDALDFMRFLFYFWHFC